jgi:hypothetical protein
LFASIAVTVRDLEFICPKTLSAMLYYTDIDGKQNELALEIADVLRSSYCLNVPFGRRGEVTKAKYAIDIVIAYDSDTQSIIVARVPINDTPTVVSADGTLVSRNDNQQITLPIVHLTRQPVKNDLKDFDNCLCFITEFSYMTVTPVPIFLRRQSAFSWSMYVDTPNRWTIIEKPDWLTLDVDGMAFKDGDEYAYDKIVSLSVKYLPEPGMYSDYVLIRNLVTNEDVYVPFLLDVDVPLSVNDKFDVLDLGVIKQSDFGKGLGYDTFELYIRRDRFWQFVIPREMEDKFDIGRVDGYSSAVTLLTFKNTWKPEPGEPVQFQFYAISDTYRVLIRVSVATTASIIAYPTAIIWTNTSESFSEFEQDISEEITYKKDESHKKDESQTVENKNIGKGKAKFRLENNGNITIRDEDDCYTGNIRNNCPWLTTQINADDTFLGTKEQIACSGENVNNLNRISAWTQRVVFCVQNYDLVINEDGTPDLPSLSGFEVMQVRPETVSQFDKALSDLGYPQYFDVNDDGAVVLSEDNGQKLYIFDITFKPEDVTGFFSTPDIPGSVAGISQSCAAQGIFFSGNAAVTLNFKFCCFGKAPKEYRIYVGYYIPAWYKIMGYSEIPPIDFWESTRDSNGQLVDNWNATFDTWLSGRDSWERTWIQCKLDESGMLGSNGIVDKGNERNLYAFRANGKTHESKIYYWSNFVDGDTGNIKRDILTYSAPDGIELMLMDVSKSTPSKSPFNQQVNSSDRARLQYDTSVVKITSGLGNVNIGTKIIMLDGIENIPAKAHCHQHFLCGWSVNLLPDAYYTKHAKVQVNTWGSLRPNEKMKQIELKSVFSLKQSEKGKNHDGTSFTEFATDNDIIWEHIRDAEVRDGNVITPAGIERFGLRKELLGTSAFDYSDEEKEADGYLYDPCNGYKNIAHELDYFAPGMFRAYEQTLTSEIPFNVTDFIGDRKIELKKYVYAKGYDDVNLLKPHGVVSTHNSCVAVHLFKNERHGIENGKWETTQPDMEHEIWKYIEGLNSNGNSGKSALNAVTYDNRAEIGHVTYRFEKPVAVRGLLAMFCVPEENATVLSDKTRKRWYVEGRIVNDADAKCSTDWFPFFQFSHSPIKCTDVNQNKPNPVGAPHVHIRPCSFPPVIVNEIRVYPCETSETSKKDCNDEKLLPIIYWTEYNPLLYSAWKTDGLETYPKDGAFNDDVRSKKSTTSLISTIGILDGYGAGQPDSGAQPHQMMAILSSSSYHAVRWDWDFLADQCVEDDVAIMAYGSSLPSSAPIDNINYVGFKYPLLETVDAKSVDGAKLMSNPKEYVPTLDINVIKSTADDDLSIKLVPIRHAAKWMEKQSGLTSGTMVSPYTLFEEIDVKSIMYMRPLNEKTQFLSYLKFFTFPHKDKLDDVRMRSEAIEFFPFSFMEKADSASLAIVPHLYPSVTDTKRWKIRVSSANSEMDEIGKFRLGWIEQNAKWKRRVSCITCGNMLGEFTLCTVLNTEALMGDLTHEGNDSNLWDVLDAYVTKVSGILPISANEPVTISIFGGGSVDRFLLRRENGKWKNYGCTMLLNNSSAWSDSHMESTLFQEACNYWNPSDSTVKDNFTKLLAYQQNYDIDYSNNASTVNRFICKDTTATSLDVFTCQFDWKYRNVYHNMVRRGCGNSLFFVLSGNSFSNMWSGQVSNTTFQFGEFQMFHKKPPCGDMYHTGLGVSNLNVHDVSSLIDRVEQPIYKSEIVNKMYPVATIFKSTASLTNLLFRTGNLEKYSGLRNKNDIVLRGHGGKTNAPDDAWTVFERSMGTKTTIYYQYLYFPTSFTKYPTELSMDDNINANWLPCRGWQYPFYVAIGLDS